MVHSSREPSSFFCSCLLAGYRYCGSPLPSYKKLNSRLAYFKVPFMGPCRMGYLRDGFFFTGSFIMKLKPNQQVRRIVKSYAFAVR